ncbi:MAG: hypothetical protein Q8K36_02335, partial [Alphaproteobacteria bacterium]|nr:hypothetical protein [Alphaproteobacteria bacterium]
SLFNIVSFALYATTEHIPFKGYKCVGEEYHDKQIVTNALKTLKPLDSDDDVLSSDTASENILANMTEYTYIKLESLGISDRVLLELSNELLKKIDEESIKSVVINLAGNNVTSDGIHILMKLLSHEKVKFFNIVDNYEISGKNIKIVCSTFYSILSSSPEYREQGDEKIKERIRLLTQKLIFIRKDYINTSSRRVMIYKDLVEKGYLDTNWAQIHKDYYQEMLSIKEDDFGDLNYLSDFDLTDRATDLK